MNMTPEQARARLLQLYLQRDNLDHQLELVKTETRDLRNFIAGFDASQQETPDPT